MCEIYPYAIDRSGHTLRFAVHLEVTDADTTPCEGCAQGNAAWRRSGSAPLRNPRRRGPADARRPPGRADPVPAAGAARAAPDQPRPPADDVVAGRHPAGDPG